MTAPHRPPRRTARELARAVESGRSVGEALRHLDNYGSGPDAPLLAESLARFLVARCESHHAGWRVVRQVVVDSAADAPWERCARRAVPLVAEDLLEFSQAEEGRMPLHRAQHLAARRRAETISPHVDHTLVLRDLGLEPADGGRGHLARSDRRRGEGALARAGRPRAVGGAGPQPNSRRSRPRSTPLTSGTRRIASSVPAM